MGSGLLWLIKRKSKNFDALNLFLMISLCFEKLSFCRCECLGIFDEV